MKNTAIVLASGGLDSTVALAIAQKKYNIALLHVNYGQKTEKKELISFNSIADFYNVDKRLLVDIKYLKVIGGSSLTDIKMEIPLPEIESKSIPSTYVPFRNTHLIAIAVSWAEVIRANYIYIGAVQDDSSGYPDCRKSYFNAYNKLINEGTRPETNIEIITPVIGMSKAQIIKKGIELSAPFHLTWSCYKNGQIACGECDSCILRLRGFKEAGYKDPIKYKYIPPGY